VNDPTVPWQQYLTAVRTLQAVRDELAAAAAADTRAASSARAELAAVHARLEHQRARLSGDGVRLRDDPPEPSEVESLTAGGPTAVHAALHECQSLLADIDAVLGSRARRARRVRKRWWRPGRWLRMRRQVRSR
jgi:uncharacterized membrane protein